VFSRLRIVPAGLTIDITMSNQPDGVSVIIPCYRSSQSLPVLVESLVQVLRDSSFGNSYEIILVVDASPDDTWEVASHLALGKDNVVAIDLARNTGQHNALLAGLEFARFSRIVTMDDDLQHRPEDVLVLLDALGPEVDLVYGVAKDEEHGAVRSLASRSTKAALGSVGVAHAKYISAFRAFRSSLISGMTFDQDQSTSIDVMLDWGTSRVRPVEVAMQARAHGASNYTTSKLVRHAMSMVTGYSTAPLRAVTWLGLILGIAGFGVLVATLVRYYMGIITEPGFTSLVSLVAFFGGLQLLGIGVLGEYLGRLHARSLKRPAFVVRSVVPARAGLQSPPVRRNIEASTESTESR
jgi:glycosyltransferase involved in cell wall biosynthesis